MPCAGRTTAASAARATVRLFLFLPPPNPVPRFLKHCVREEPDTRHSGARRAGRALSFGVFYSQVQGDALPILNLRLRGGCVCACCRRADCAGPRVQPLAEGGGGACRTLRCLQLAVKSYHQFCGVLVRYEHFVLLPAWRARLLVSSAQAQGRGAPPPEKTRAHMLAAAAAQRRSCVRPTAPPRLWQLHSTPCVAMRLHCHRPRHPRPRPVLVLVLLGGRCSVNGAEMHWRPRPPSGRAQQRGEGMQDDRRGHRRLGPRASADVLPPRRCAPHTHILPTHVTGSLFGDPD